MLRPLFIFLLLASWTCAAGPATQPARDDAPTMLRQLSRSNTVVNLAPRAYTAATPIVLSGIHDLTVFAYGVTLTADAGQTTFDVSGKGDTLRLINCQRVTILGMSFHGNRKARGGFAPSPVTVRLQSCDGVTLRDCSWEGDVCDALYLSGGYKPQSVDLACKRVTVDNCRFSDPGRNCISMIGAQWCNITNCDFGDAVTSAPFAGIDIEANPGDPDGINHHITIANNRMRNVRCAVQIVQVTTPTGIVITGNQIDGTRGDGIYNEGKGTLIVGNNVTNCPDNAAGISCSPPGTMIQTGNSATVWPK